MKRTRNRSMKKATESSLFRASKCQLYLLQSTALLQVPAGVVDRASATAATGSTAGVAVAGDSASAVRGLRIAVVGMASCRRLVGMFATGQGSERLAPRDISSFDLCFGLQLANNHCVYSITVA